MQKPENPFRPRSNIWALMEEDWSDLTASQIAEVLDTTTEHIYSTMRRITRETGYRVPYKRRNEVEHGDNEGSKSPV
jgi:hypothetical protein